MRFPMLALLALAAAGHPSADREPRGGTPLPVPDPGPTLPREKPDAIPSKTARRRAKQLRNALETR